LIVRNDTHTEFLLPIKSEVFDWETEMPLSSIERVRKLDTIRWLGFGWGERDFFINTPTWDKLTIAGGLRAFFYSRGSLVHVTAYREVGTDDENVRVLKLSAGQLKALTDYIRMEFARDADEKPIRVADGYGGGDAFYEAKSHYSLFNTWTANGLRYASLPAPVWGWLPQSIMRHLP
jgi:uncharacterized protein (TIGR02117 family)